MTATSLQAADTRAVPPAKPDSGRWILPVMLCLALLIWLATVASFLALPLERLPLYFAHRYLVLDATSMLFVLVINTVFLGIGVYMLSRERGSPELIRDLRTRALWSSLFMLLMNLGVM